MFARAPVNRDIENNSQNRIYLVNGLMYLPHYCFNFIFVILIALPDVNLFKGFAKVDGCTPYSFLVDNGFIFLNYCR